MKKVFNGCLAKLGRHRRRNLLIILALLFFLSGAVGLGLTKEKAQMRKVPKINNAENVRVKNIGCNIKELNPLRRDEHPEINKVIAEYFQGLTEGETFVEKYDDLHVYTKVGQYRGTYIAFAEYRMKIKDIYTEVPGLVTIYVSKDDKSGQYQIDTKDLDEQKEEYVHAMAEHADVQEMLRQTEDEFAEAVHSDALLREALADLKQAYSAYSG